MVTDLKTIQEIQKAREELKNEIVSENFVGLKNCYVDTIVPMNLLLLYLKSLVKKEE